MILPTTDYTPLRQAKSQLAQAKRSQFIAPQIEYQTKGLQLQEKGLERTRSHIAEQQTINELQFGYEVTKTMIESAFAAGKGAQMAKAQSMGNGMANAWQSKVSEMVSNGQMYVSSYTDQDPTDAEGGVTSAYIVGMDKLQEFQNQQIQQIESQNWFPSVKNQTIAAMQGIYSNGQARMLQDYYANETKARFQLEQQNLADAIDMDIASGTLSSPSYTNTMATIANMNRGPNASALLARTSVQDIDLGVAANSVRETAVSSGRAAARSLANQISDDRGYNPDTRNRLLRFGEHEAHQAEINAQDAGTQFMKEFIASGNRDFVSAFNQVDERMAGKPEEQAEAYRNAAKGVYHSYCNNIVADVVKGMPETLTSADVKKAIKTLKGDSDVFKGTPEAKKIFDDTIAKWEKADQILVSGDYAEKYETLKNIYMPHLLDGSVSARQVFDMIDAGMEKAKENGDNNKLAAYQQLAHDIIKTTQGEFVNPAIKRAEQTISDSMKWYFGNDTFRGDPRIRELYNGIVREAEADIIDLCMTKGKLSNAEVDKVANDIMGRYVNQESVVRAAAEGNGYVARIQGKKTAKGTEETDEYANEFVTDLATRFTSAIKAENSNKEAADKKHNFGDSETYEKNAATLEMIKKNSLPFIDKTISSMQPSNIDSFTDKMDEEYYLLKKDPNKWLDKFEDTKTSDKNPWIDNPGKDYTINVSNQNMNLFDKELEDMYPLVSGTQQGRNYVARRKELEQGMITYFMGYIGKPVDPEGWQPPIYSPDDGGWTYKNGDTIFRNVRYGNGFQVQTLDENNEWVTETPASKPYDNTTTEGVDQIVNKNTEIQENALGKGNALRYWNKHTQQWQDEPVK